MISLREIRTMCHKHAIDNGNMIAQRRIAMGIRQHELATLTDLTPASISRIEDGLLVPRDYVRVAIAAALDVEPGELWPYPPLADVRALADDPVNAA